MLTVMFILARSCSRSRQVHLGQTPQNGPHQTELPAHSGSTERLPFPPSPISLSPDPHHAPGTHGFGGDNPRALAQQMTSRGVSCPPLPGLRSGEHDSALILMSVLFQHGNSKSPAWEGAGEKNPTAMPSLGKKKILGNKIQRHLFILFFSVIILKMKNS